jgi:hypothetical protein
MGMTAPKSAETDALKLLLQERQGSIDSLAAAAGVKAVTLRKQISANFPRRRLRLVLEAVLDTPIWSAQKDFVRRKYLKARLDFDPFTIPVRQLRQYVGGLKISERSQNRTRQKLVRLLESYLSPQTQKQD